MFGSKFALAGLAVVLTASGLPSVAAGAVTATHDGTILRIIGSDDSLESVRADVEAGAWTVSGADTAVTAGSGCATDAFGRVRCPLAVAIEADMGPGIDHLVIADSTGTGYSTSTLQGGLGRDGIRVQSGDGSDRLFGGPGIDGLDGGPGSDVLDGGPGIDQVSFAAGRTAGRGVRASIGGGVGDDGSADDGPVGARDTIRPNVEELAGTTGRDLLIGTDGPDFLEGAAGADVLRGRPGRDKLTGGAGPDVLLGGDGLDFLLAVGPGPGSDRDRRLDCGRPDRPERTRLDPEDPAPSSC